MKKDWEKYWIVDKNVVYNIRRPDRKYKYILDIDDDFLKMLGLYLAEGHPSYNGEISFAFNIKEKDLQEFINKFFTGYGFNVRKIINGNSTTMIINSVLLYQFFKRFDYNDRIGLTNDFMLLPPEKQLKIYEGFRLGDGWELRNMLHVCTISKKLGYQLLNILLRNNFVATLRELKRYRYGKRNKNQFWIELDRIDTKSYLLNKPPVEHRAYKKFVGNYLLYSVRKREDEIIEEDVFNFSVEEDESYVYENVIVHNCFDSCMGAFRYRGEAFETLGHGITVQAKTDTFSDLGSNSQNNNFGPNIDVMNDFNNFDDYETDFMNF